MGEITKCRRLFPHDSSSLLLKQADQQTKKKKEKMERLINSSLQAARDACREDGDGWRWGREMGKGKEMIRVVSGEGESKKVRGLKGRDCGAGCRLQGRI